MAAGRVVLASRMPAIDGNGVPISGAKLYQYANRTTDLASIYADEGLTVARTNPVVADSGGRFPDIYAEAGTIDDPVYYSVQITDSAGTPVASPSTFHDYQPSLDYSTASLALSEAAADRAELAALAAEAASGAGAGSGATFGPYDADGTTATFTMAEAVQAGGEASVGVYVYGVRQVPTAYSCDGTTTLTFSEPPAEGTNAVEGVHEGSSSVIAIDQPAEAAVASGRLLTTSARFSRTLDVYDYATIYRNGVSDDSAALVTALSSNRYLTHHSGSIYFGDDDTFPEYCTLHVTRGTINVAAGKTLTIPATSRIVAPPWAQIFTGTGEVRGLVEAWAPWFGAFGDYDEAEVDGDDPTLVAAKLNRMARASQRMVLLDQAYGLEEPFLLLPTLGQPQIVIGAGTSTAGGGTRLYATAGGAATLWVRGSQTGINAISEYGVRDLTIAPSDDPSDVGLLIAGDGGAAADGSGDKRLTGLVSNVIENVHVTDMARMFEVRSLNRLRLRNCTGIAAALDGAECLRIGLSTGGAQCTEVDVEGCTFAPRQTGAGGGYGVRLINSEVASVPDIAEVRGITFDDNTQIYAGRSGYSLDIYGEAATGKAKTIGDVTVSEGCKIQGDGADGTITALKAIRVNARNAAKISCLKFNPTQIEGFAGDAVDIRVTASASTFGTVEDVDINTTFRYLGERSVYADGVRGLTLTGKQQYCGLAAATSPEHVLLVNCVSSRVENFRTSAKDSARPGLATMVRVTGAGTLDVKTRANAGGTGAGSALPVVFAGSVTDTTNSKDSTDQPSILGQV